MSLLICPFHISAHVMYSPNRCLRGTPFKITSHHGRGSRRNGATPVPLLKSTGRSAPAARSGVRRVAVVVEKRGWNRNPIHSVCAIYAYRLTPPRTTPGLIGMYGSPFSRVWEWNLRWFDDRWKMSNDPLRRSIFLGEELLSTSNF